MKKFIILLAVMTISLSASAQLATDSFSEDREREDGWLQQGYRGFLEIGMPCPVQCGRGEGVSIKTTHGYQFSEWFFAGLGIGYTNFVHIEDYWDYDCYPKRDSFNAFGDFKLTIPTESRFYPYLEARFGIAVPAVYDGVFFFEVPVGCRVALNDKLGINAGVSFQLYGWGNPLAVGPFVSFDF
ncbi:MAG: hypothetical protein J6C81_00730 [Muribaculaceae bacterium]|nr:hypothetical protein [Muribaculaceae bacterium]